MGTRSNIGYETDNGNVFMVYCHWDGYPSGVGVAVQDMDFATAKTLVNGGDMSKVGEPYTARGEKYEDLKPRRYAGIEAAKKDMEEYLYVINPAGEWVVSDHGGEFVPLAEAIANE